MTSKQQIVAILGVILLVLSFWESWQPELKAVLGFGVTFEKYSLPSTGGTTSAAKANTGATVTPNPPSYIVTPDIGQLGGTTGKPLGSKTNPIVTVKPPKKKG